MKDIDVFHINVCRSERYFVDFAIVSPEPVSMADPELQQFMEAFISFHLAIKPNVPVILFEIESLVGVGSRVFGGNEGCQFPIYHLPPDAYNKLENIVQETYYCVAQTFLNHVIGCDRLNNSIFSDLAGIRQELGLVVLGVYREDA